MARVITAPENLAVNEGEISCFLAGGITNCAEWQDEVISALNSCDTSQLVLFNPRRKNFDVANPNASREQIEWEFEALNKMNIFSMYFDNSESVQPICFYELGRHLVRMPFIYSADYKQRIIVSIQNGFSRRNDVVIQTALALNSDDVVRDVHSPKEHASMIYYKYRNLL